MRKRVCGHVFETAASHGLVLTVGLPAVVPGPCRGRIPVEA